MASLWQGAEEEEEGGLAGVGGAEGCGKSPQPRGAARGGGGGAGGLSSKITVEPQDARARDRGGQEVWVRGQQPSGERVSVTCISTVTGKATPFLCVHLEAEM